MEGGAQGQPRLRREIGFFGLLAFSVGINIGAGLFVLVNIAAELTGPSMILALGISAIPAMLALIPYRVLARGYPTTSATYRYTQLASPRLAQAVAATVIATVVIGGQPLFARAAGDYLSEIVPIAPLAIGLAALAIFAAVNVWGVKPTAVIQIVLLVALIGGLVLYIALGAGSVKGANFTPFFDGGGVGLLFAAGILFALMAGGLFIIDVGDEVIDPRRVFGWVLPLGMVIVLLLYIGIFIVTSGAVPTVRLEDETLVVAAETFMGSVPFALFVIGGALVAAVTTLNVTFTLVSRAMLVVSRDGLLPRVFTRIHPKTGTPVPALLAVWAVATLTFVANPSTQFLGAVLNIGLVVAISGVVLSALRLPDRYPEVFEAGRGGISRRTMRVTSRSVLIMNGIILLLLFAGTPAAGLTVAAIAGITMLVARLSGAPMPVPEPVVWRPGMEEAPAPAAPAAATAPQPAPAAPPEPATAPAPTFATATAAEEAPPPLRPLAIGDGEEAQPPSRLATLAWRTATGLAILLAAASATLVAVAVVTSSGG